MAGGKGILLLWFNRVVGSRMELEALSFVARRKRYFRKSRLRKLNYLNGKEIAKKKEMKKILITLLVSVRRFISHFRQLLETRAVSVSGF